jgi:flagellar motor switch protein FliN
MTRLAPESIASVIAACQANVEDIAAAFSRALGATVEASLGLATTWQASAGEGFSGPGLVLAFLVDEAALVAVLPESSLLPPWYAQPTASAQQCLMALAKELSRLILPAEISVREFFAIPVPSLVEAIGAAAPAAKAARVPLVLRAEEARQGTLSLIWPLEKAERLAPRRGVVRSSTVSAASVDELPAYTRSLLRIPLPVSVTLATRKQPVRQILDLGVGSVIHFDKPCDEPLDLEVNGHRVARGEAVKVGDKFGLRIQSVVLPGERFKPLRRP